jgi:hypothetical protein
VATSPSKAKKSRRWERLASNLNTSDIAAEAEKDKSGEWGILYEWTP